MWTPASSSNAESERMGSEQLGSLAKRGVEQRLDSRLWRPAEAGGPWHLISDLVPSQFWTVSGSTSNLEFAQRWMDH